MATWQETIQTWGTAVINGAVDKEFNQNYELEKLRLLALGPGGYYDEGQAGVYKNAQNNNVLGMSPGVLLLLGGAAVVLLLVMDK